VGYGTGNYPADGTIYDDGFDETGTSIFVGYPSRFLAQSLIEYTIQAGCDMEAELGFDWGTLNLSLGYLFEYIWNRNLEPGRDEMWSYFHVQAGYKY
jgi:hypothetical protein